MVDPVTATGLWTAGTCLGSAFLGNVIANNVSSLGYDLGKASLQKLIEGARIQDGELPANHDLQKASRDSLRAAMVFAFAGTAQKVGKKPPLFQAIWDHWQKGTLFDQPLLEVRDTEAHSWLNGFKIAVEQEFGAFEQNVRFEECDAAVLLVGESAGGLANYVHKQLDQWATSEITTGERPAAFAEGLKHGWQLDDQISRATFFQAYCLFFRERLKNDTNAFRAYVGPAIAALTMKVDQLASPVNTELLVDQLYDQTLKTMGQLLGELRQFIAEEFEKVHERFDTVDTGIQEVKAELQKGFAARGPVQAIPAIRSPVPDFEGREDVLKTLRRDFEKSGVLIAAALHGQGGIGKTELAVKLASEQKDRFPDGQILVELQGTAAKPKSPEKAMEEVLRDLLGPTAQLPEDPTQLAHTYQAELATKKVLLLLDNAANKQQVEPLLPPDGCGVIVTSRQHFVLPGLTPTHLDKLDSESAERLALRIAPQLNSLAKPMVETCGYLALAIRIAASSVAEQVTLTPEEHLERLRANRLARLEPVAAAIKASYDLLTEEAQKYWQRLGVFPETFDLPAAAAVAAGNIEKRDSARDILDLLHRASMIEYDAARRRYWLHDLSRDFAVQCMERDIKEAREARLRHARHYTTVLAAANELYLEGGTQLLAGHALFDSERTNIESAEVWVVRQINDERGSAKLALQFADAGAYVLNLRLHEHERIQWLEKALLAAREIGDRRGEGNTLGNLGRAYAALGDARKAIGLYEEHLVIAREIGDRGGEATALFNMAIWYDGQGERDQAIRYMEQAVSIYEAIESPGADRARQILDQWREGA